MSECPPDQIIFDYDSQEYVCMLTGEVIEDRPIVDDAEWRAFSYDEYEKRARAGLPLNPTYHDYGLMTVIDTTARKDGQGKRLEVETRRKAQRLMYLQRRGMIEDSRERNLVKALNELDRFAKALNLPENVKEEAARIYRKALDNGLVKGRSIKMMVAGSIYTACRVIGVPVTLDYIAEVTGVNRKDLVHAYRLIIKRLNIKVKLLSPEEFIPQLVHKLGLPEKAVVDATKILKEVREKNPIVVLSKDPVSLASTVIYIAGLIHGYYKTQKEICKVAYVTEVTIRNRYRELARVLGIDLWKEPGNEKNRLSEAEKKIEEKTQVVEEHGSGIRENLKTRRTERVDVDKLIKKMRKKIKKFRVENEENKDPVIKFIIRRKRERVKTWIDKITKKMRLDPEIVEYAKMIAEKIVAHPEIRKRKTPGKNIAISCIYLSGVLNKKYIEHKRLTKLLRAKLDHQVRLTYTIARVMSIEKELRVLVYSIPHRNIREKVKLPRGVKLFAHTKLAKILGVEPRKIFYWCRDKKIECIPVDDKIYVIPREEAKKHIEKLTA